MSTATVFRPGGHHYRVWDETIDLLKRGLQGATRLVFGWIVRKELAGTLATEKPTDVEIGQELGIAPRTVQKALHALDTDVLEVNDGQPLIDRESGLGCHGKRTIGLTVGLAPSGTRRPAEAAAPPQTPPEGEEKKKNTTTKEGSSSSSEKAPEKTPDPDDPAIAGLVTRARALVPDATPKKVADAVAVYGADWVRRALDVAERRPKKKLGNLAVQEWIYVLGILKNWKEEDGPPPEKPPQPAAVPRASPEPSAPLPKLLPEQLAELVAKCSQGPQALRTLAVSQIRRAILDDLVPPELLATIPAELLAAPEVATPHSS
jgi:hypothetical protein